MLTRLQLRLHDRIERRPALALALATGVALLGALGLVGARVDMSFRPLFADRGGEVEATRRFEEVFGQPSGAHLGVVIDAGDPLSPPFLARLSRLSAAVEELDHVVEVASLARIAVPVWDGEGARGRRLVEPAELESDAGAERLAAALAAHPELARGLLARSGGRTLLLARVDLPLSDLEGRRRVLAAFEEVTRAHMGDDAGLRFVGVSVVEAAYARIVLRSLVVSFGLTTLAVLLVLGALFRRVALVAVAMTGVSLATPATLGIVTLLGRDLTILGSVVPILILVIGVADAIHMTESFGRNREKGLAKGAATRAMMADMALPCFLTTLTTGLGFLALGVARIGAIREFGTSVALGIGLVWALNLVTVPALLHLVPEAWLGRPRSHGPADRGLAAVAALLVRRPGVVALGAYVLVAAASLGIPRVDANQRFNEEVSPDHPVRADQALLEREFGGFLGPEVLVSRRDGAPLTDPADLSRIAAFRDSVSTLAGVHRVRSFLDLLAPGVEGPDAARGLSGLREDSLLGPTARELVDGDARRGVLLVRTGDLGTAGARRLAAGIESAEEAVLGPGMEARVVGQWWLAQEGMSALISDLVRSLLTSALLVLPLILMALRSVRLFLVSLVPNVLPIALALAFMGWAGISLRIGTAVVLAVALGIAVDDTLHLLVRLARGNEGEAPARRVTRALHEAGRPIVYTTLVLVAGFLSMLANPLLAIRDMGTVGAFTLGVALLADLVLAPVLFVLVFRPSRRTRTSSAADEYVAARTPVLPSSP